MSIRKNKETSTSIHPFIVGSLIVTGVWLGSILLLNLLFGDSHNEKAAWFGDSFGGVNSLFSGLAFAGIIYTILLQRKELQLQRQELRETREELKRSADAQEKSEAAFTKQIDIMNKSAVISGMSTMVEYYGMQLQRSDDPERRRKFEKLAGDMAQQVIKVLNIILDEYQGDAKRKDTSSANTKSYTE